MEKIDRISMEGCGRSYDATELRLGLPGTDRSGLVVVARPNKRPLPDQSNKRREAKAQVVGWPPVRSYRRNCVNTPEAEDGDDQSAIYVKVSMDGAPYLRKIDLKAYKKYKDLTQNLEDMFKWRFSPNDEHVITYEDRDGDWMMVGDVPWEMFISTCKRLRIMKGSEARGLNSSP